MGYFSKFVPGFLQKALSSGSDQPTQRSMAVGLIPYQAGTSIQALPEYSTKLLKKMAENTPHIRACVSTIVLECTRSIQFYDRCWDLYPKDPEDDAEEPGEKDLNELLMRPDRRNRRSFNAVIQSFITDLLIYDDAFVSIAYDEETGLPGAIYNEEREGMYIRVDKKGNLGDGTYFCPKCKMSREFKPEEFVKFKGKCPDHPKQSLKMNAFVQMVDGEITGRWAADEMIWTHLWRTGSKLYGSPPLQSLIWATDNMVAMDQYYSDSYHMRRTPEGLLVFNGMDQKAVNSAAEKVTLAVSENPHMVGWMGAPEGKSVEYVQMSFNAEQLQSIDFYKLYADQIYRVFHVTPMVGGMIESGRTGANPDAQLAVQNDFIRAIQRQVGEAFTNSPLFDAFKVTKKYLGFTPVEEEEEKDQADTQLVWAQVAKAWQDAQFSIQLDEDGRPMPVDKGEVEPREPEPMFSPFGGQRYGQEDPNLNEKPRGFDEKKGDSRAYYDELVKGAPGPRNMPEDGYIRGLRTDELAFYRALDQKYKALISESLSKLDSMDTTDQLIVQREIEDLIRKMKEELTVTARAALRDIYVLGFNQAEDELGVSLSFDSRDQSALDYLFSSYKGVDSVLPEFSVDQERAFTDILKQAFAEPGKFDMRWMIDQMKGVSNAETWKLARIARSETTLIVNQGRARAYAKADPESIRGYDWVTAHDGCDICNNIAAGNPWKLGDLELETDGLRPHPNCRCTVAMRPFIADSQNNQ